MWDSELGVGMGTGRRANLNTQRTEVSAKSKGEKKAGY